MKQLLEFIPIILFFIAFKLYDIYVATGAVIVATIILVAYNWIRYRKVETMQWITLGLIIVMGGATILLHDEQFIKWSGFFRQSVYRQEAFCRAYDVQQFNAALFCMAAFKPYVGLLFLERWLYKSLCHVPFQHRSMGNIQDLWRTGFDDCIYLAANGFFV
jgi:Intracellular septation protein A